MHWSKLIRDPNEQIEPKTEFQQPDIKEIPKLQTDGEAIPAPPAQQVVVNNQEILDSIADLSKKVEEGLKLSAAAKSTADTILTGAEANQILLQLLHYQDKYFPMLPLNEIQCREFISNIPRTVFESAAHNFGYDNEYDLMNPIFLFYIMCVGDHHNETMGKFLSIICRMMNEEIEFINDLEDEFDGLDDQDEESDYQILCDECFIDNEDIMRCSNEDCQNYPKELDDDSIQNESDDSGCEMCYRNEDEELVCENPDCQNFVAPPESESTQSYDTSSEQKVIEADDDTNKNPFQDTKDISTLIEEDDYPRGNQHQRNQGKKKKQHHKHGRNIKGKS